MCAFKMNAPGTPLPDNHPLKGVTIFVGARRPTQPQAIQNLDPAPLPEWDGQVEVVFSIAEEDKAGGSSYCWVERRGDDYILFGNELGPMSVACVDASSALGCTGADFGMDFVEVKSRLEVGAFREALGHVDLSGVSHLTVNNEQVESRDIEVIVAQYKPER
ncbi:MAG: hypothetical protein IPJ08_14635 [Burkholderiales bacterium]|nr:hypothetical protein [Burkholderiales bacterium]